MLKMFTFRTTGILLLIAYMKKLYGEFPICYILQFLERHMKCVL